MSKLILEANFSDADAFYAALTDIHRDLSPEQSEKVNARLVLILANQIGNQETLEKALQLASDLSEEE